MCDSALYFAEKGLQVIPLKEHSKTPGYPWKPLQYNRIDWNHVIPETYKDGKVKRSRFDAREFARVAFVEGCNIGFITGAVSSNTIVLDGDTSEAFKALKRALTVYGITTRIHRTTRGGHILLQCDTPLKNASVKDDTGTCFDLLAHNRICVLPPSTKKLDDGSIFTYYIDPDSADDIASVDFETLQKVIQHVFPEFILQKRYEKYKAETLEFLYRATPLPTGDRNNMLMRVIPDFRNHNTEAHTRQVMTKRANVLIPDEIEQNAKTIESALSSYIKPTKNRKRIGEIALDALPYLPFTGRTRRS
jgi:hypothetical protein